MKTLIAITLLAFTCNLNADPLRLRNIYSGESQHVKILSHYVDTFLESHPKLYEKSVNSPCFDLHWHIKKIGTKDGYDMVAFSLAILARKDPMFPGEEYKSTMILQSLGYATIKELDNDTIQTMFTLHSLLSSYDFDKAFPKWLGIAEEKKE